MNETNDIIEMLKKIDNKMNVIDDRMNAIDDRMNAIENKMNAIDEEVRSLRFTVENVISKNIMTIAEGHMDLNRRLDEALANSNEREMVLLRLNILEDDVRILKSKTSA